MKSFDIIVVGHFSIDHIEITGQRPQTRLGGPVTYTSLAAENLGAKVAVISKVGYGFPQTLLRILVSKGIDLSEVKKSAKPTTELLLTYADDEREIRLLRKCDKFTENDLPTLVKGKIIHIAPIVGEIEPSIAVAYLERGEISSLDPQGFLRNFGQFGNMKLKRWFDLELLSKVDILKCSREELMMMTGTADVRSLKRICECGVKVTILTLGEQGVICATGSEIFHAPAYNSENVVDPTGAGDAFIGGFLSAYLGNPDEHRWCVAIGVASASACIEHPGSLAFEHKQDVKERAEKVYENIRTLKSTDLL